MPPKTKRLTPNGAPARTGRADPRDRLLADFATLKVPLLTEQLDAVLARADRERLTHLEFTQLLIAEQAQQRRERSIAGRIREARFREPHTLAGFDWEFNAKTINRVQIEELATAAFIGRQDNLVIVGQSGVGKTRIIQAVGLEAGRWPSRDSASVSCAAASAARATCSSMPRSVSSQRTTRCCRWRSR